MELLFGLIILAMIVNAISWIYQQIQEAVEKRKSAERDKIAIEMLAHYKISDEDRSQFRGELSKLSSLVTPTTSYEPLTIEPQYKSNRPYVLCNSCGGGVMILRKSKYGRFLGCSNYPECKATQKITQRDLEGERSLKNKYAEVFMDELLSVYK